MKSSFSLLLFLNFLIGFSQSIEDIKIETKKIYDANYLMEFETIVMLSYSKYIESIGKDKVLKQLDYEYQNEEFGKRLQLVNPVFIYSDLIKVEDKFYCVISYKNPVRYFFEKKLSTQAATKKIDFLKETTQSKDVIFEPKRNSFNVRKNSKLIAIFDQNTQGNWKFLNLDDESQRLYFNNFCSESTKKQLGL